jgi:hypothetical protein
LMAELKSNLVLFANPPLTFKKMSIEVLYGS